MRFTRSIYALGAMALIAAPAHADLPQPAWSANATSCTPDADSVLGQRYTTTGQKVAHRGSNVDQIQLVCPINVGATFSGGDWQLVTTYRDSTAAGTTAFVSARLVRVSRVNGNAATVATFNSNVSDVTGVNKVTVGFSHTFNFDATYYYVQIVLDRTLASEVVQAYGVAIEAVPP